MGDECSFPTVIESHFLNYLLHFGILVAGFLPSPKCLRQPPATCRQRPTGWPCPLRPRLRPPRLPPALACPRPPAARPRQHQRVCDRSSPKEVRSRTDFGNFLACTKELVTCRCTVWAEARQYTCLAPPSSLALTLINCGENFSAALTFEVYLVVLAAAI
jgi:hypothetical protein